MDNPKFFTLTYTVVMILVAICFVVVEILITQRRCAREKHRCAIISLLKKLIYDIEQQESILGSYPNISKYMNVSYDMLERVLYDSPKKYRTMVVTPLYKANDTPYNIKEFVSEIDSLDRKSPIFRLVHRLSDIYGYYWRCEHPCRYLCDTIKKIISLQIFRILVDIKAVISVGKKEVENNESVQYPFRRRKLANRVTIPILQYML